MKIRSVFGILFCVLSLSSVCSAKTVKNGCYQQGSQYTIVASDKWVTRDVAVSDFSKLTVSAPVKVVYTPGSTAKLSIKAPENLFSWIDTKVSGKTLSIKYDSKVSVEFKESSDDVEIYVSSATLSDLTVTSPAKVTIKGDLNAKDLNLDISGVGSVTGENIFAKSACFGLNTCAEVKFNKVNVGKLSVDAIGVSKLNLGDTQASTAKISVGNCSELNIKKGEYDSLSLDASDVAGATIDKLSATTVSVNAVKSSTVNLKSGTCGYASYSAVRVSNIFAKDVKADRGSVEANNCSKVESKIALIESMDVRGVSDVVNGSSKISM